MVLVSELVLLLLGLFHIGNRGTAGFPMIGVEVWRKIGPPRVRPPGESTCRGLLRL